MSNKFVLIPAALLLAACGTTPEKKVEKAPEPPAEAVGAQKGFFRTFPSARTWSPDVMPMRIESIAIPEVKNGEGKYGAWRITYVSTAKSKSKVFTYSVAESPGNAYKDVFSPLEERWGGPGGSALPFRMESFKVESDKAYATAIEKIKPYLAKNPGKTANILIEWNKRFPQPTYRFYWGGSLASAEQTVYVDVATGQFVAKEP
jgi:hypothetical protein